MAGNLRQAKELCGTELDDRVKCARRFGLGSWQVFDAVNGYFDGAGKRLLLHDVL